MYTADAIISDVINNCKKVWIQLDYDGRCFSSYHEFDLKYLKDVDDLMSLMKFTNSKEIEDLLGKYVRVIDNGDVRNSLVAIGSMSKDKFIALYLDSFPISEKKLYRKYRQKIR